MDAMQTQFKELVNTTANSKSYSRKLVNNPTLLQYAKEFASLHNTESFAEVIFCIVNGITPNICACGNKVAFATYDAGYRTYCSRSCTCKATDHAVKVSNQWKDPQRTRQMVQACKTTNTKKYGVDNPMKRADIQAKLKQSNFEKYGVEYSLARADVQAKVRETVLLKYGVEYAQQSAEVKDKIQSTCMSRYGRTDAMHIAREQFLATTNGLNPFQLPAVQAKTKSTLFQKYGVEAPLQNPVLLAASRATLKSNYNRGNPAQLHLSDEIYNILQDCNQLKHLLETMPLAEICLQYNISRSLIISYHNRYKLNIIPIRARSSYEEEIAKLLTDLGIEYIRNYTKICSPKQLDFFIPAHNLAIEFNGLYWHSVNSGKKDKHYHANKTKICTSNGIQLLTIFEDEWIHNSSIIIKKIKHLCKLTTITVGARKILISQTTDLAMVKQFLNEYHIQGKTEGNSYMFAGTYNGELVAVVTLRKVSGAVYDMTRFCTKMDASYPGLFSKFVKHISNTTDATVLETVADLRWSTGDVYLKTGFTQVSIIKPDYSYTDYHTREHKFNYRKSKIKTKYNIDINGQTELQLTQQLGLDRIWDCGKIKYRLHLQ